jgi:hypothetical protein
VLASQIGSRHLTVETGAINADPEEHGIDWSERKLTWIGVLQCDLIKQTQECEDWKRSNTRIPGKPSYGRMAKLVFDEQVLYVLQEPNRNIDQEMEI